MRRMPVALIACAFTALGFSPQADVTLHRQSRRVMGSLAEIQVYHADAGVAEKAMSAALDEMERIDGLLSNYKPDSELSRMNAGAPKAPFRASQELYDFVKACRRYFDDTDGTFDPTMGPVVRAWGFFTPRPARPSDADAGAAKARSGFDKVTLDDASRSVSYTVDGVEFDPGGVGKGYAADRAVSVLRRFGVTSALVSAGGSTFYALGYPPGQQGWKLAVRDPSSPATTLRFVVLRDAAISTSGIYGRYVEIAGRRYGHIINPKTREPLEGMCQVSVIAPNATDSDALTKAAFLLTREPLVRMFSALKAVHVLRVEGACAESGEVWTAPWSAGVFALDAGTKPALRK